MSDQSTHPDAAGDPAGLDEQLVAYLDGELDDQTAREVESLVAGNPKLRNRLEELGGTWELLDHLDRSETEATFTESTLELVVTQVEDESRRGEAGLSRLRRRRRARIAAGFLLAAAAGFALVAFFRPDANGQLLRDLPVVENVDEYIQIVGGNDSIDENIDLLRKLRAANLFVEENQEEETAAADVRGESPDQRRDHIDQMAPDQQAELAQRWTLFANLDAERQEQIRRFDERLDAEEHPEALRAVMRRYCAWLDTLSGFRQEELRKMPVDQRVKVIGDERYWAQDSRELRRWFWDICKRNIDALRRQAKDKPPRKAELNVRSIEMRLASQSEVNARAQALQRIVSPEDLARLRAQLSPASGLKNIENTQDQYKWVVRELEKSWRQWWRQERQQRVVEGLGGPRKEVSDKELAEFLQSDSLTDDQKKWLLSLPGKEMYEKLRFLYLSQDRPPGPGIPGRERPPRQGPPFWPRRDRDSGPDHQRPPETRQGHRPVGMPPGPPGDDLGPPPAGPSEVPPVDGSPGKERNESRGAPDHGPA